MISNIGMLQGCCVFLLSIHFCQGADVAYGLACTVADDTCTAAGTTCKDSSGTDKCICDGLFVANAGDTACECKTGYAVNTAGDACLAGVGATCTASGDECWHVLGGYCNTAVTSAVCACGSAYTASTTTCAGTTCAADTTCAALDANAICYDAKCKCKVGYIVNPSGTSTKCVTAFGSGAKGVVASMAVLIGSFLVSTIHL